jgi:hypothetical protein
MNLTNLILIRKFRPKVFHKIDPRSLELQLLRVEAVAVDDAGGGRIDLRETSEVQNIQGPMFLFFKYFRRKIRRNIRRKMAFLTQNKAKLCKILIITLVCKKNAIFSPKIVITSSTPW